ADDREPGRPAKKRWDCAQSATTDNRPSTRARTLDHWLKRQNIHCLIRHQAAADALATAELMLSLWPKVRARLDGRFSVVADWAQSHRFMAGRPGSR
ncbi:MAG: hypothetical protein ACK47V_14025, partial [Betaproteobacteria bacterium]